MTKRVSTSADRKKCGRPAGQGNEKNEDPQTGMNAIGVDENFEGVVSCTALIKIFFLRYSTVNMKYDGNRSAQRGP